VGGRTTAPDGTAAAVEKGQIDAVRGAVSCFNGATIMGDGSAALILDVSSLL
jgi:hypothetical protein